MPFLMFLSFNILSLSIATLIVLCVGINIVGVPLLMGFITVFAFLLYYPDRLILQASEAKLLSKSQWPKGAQLVDQLAFHLNIKVAKIYQVDSDSINAMIVSDLTGAKSLVISTKLREKLSAADINGVLLYLLCLAQGGKIYYLTFIFALLRAIEYAIISSTKMISKKSDVFKIMLNLCYVPVKELCESLLLSSSLYAKAIKKASSMAKHKGVIETPLANWRALIAISFIPVIISPLKFFNCLSFGHERYMEEHQLIE